MPISKNEFDKGHSEDPIIHRIEDFLQSNNEKAFTEEEIMSRLYPEHIAWPGDTVAFNIAMLILAYAGKIELRLMPTSLGVKTYFRSKS